MYMYDVLICGQEYPVDSGGGENFVHSMHLHVGAAACST
jgi:hypothetical protein